MLTTRLLFLLLAGAAAAESSDNMTINGAPEPTPTAITTTAAPFGIVPASPPS